jgi:peptide chain release factor
METKIIQITSGKGPEECERVVALVLEKMKKQAQKENIHVEIIDYVEGKQYKTYLSVLFKITGDSITEYCHTWNGTIQWIGQSPFRKFHKRKNWFVGVSVYEVPKLVNWNEKDFVYQTFRSSGAGGQNVNKVESAVRIIHIPTGISVTASNERSQLQNKKEAFERLKNQLLALQLNTKNKIAREQWMEHNELERGNAVKVFKEEL